MAGVALVLLVAAATAFAQSCGEVHNGELLNARPIASWDRRESGMLSHPSG